MKKKYEIVAKVAGESVVIAHVPSDRKTVSQAAKILRSVSGRPYRMREIKPAINMIDERM